MKKIIIIIVCLPLLFCFKQNNEETITITIVNKELSCLKIDNYYLGGNLINYTNLEKSFKARNLVEYKFQNNTDKNYLLIVNPYVFDIHTGIIPKIELPSEYLSMRITDNDNNLAEIITGSKKINDDDVIKLLDLDQESFKLKEAIKIEKNYRKKKSLKNCFIIKANETKTFCVQLDLPIIEEAQIDNSLDFLALNLVNEEYDFQLIYYMNKSEINKLLTEEEKSFLRNTDIEIFQGELKSNLIKLKFVE